MEGSHRRFVVGVGAGRIRMPVDHRGPGRLRVCPAAGAGGGGGGPRGGPPPPPPGGPRAPGRGGGGGGGGGVTRASHRGRRRARAGRRSRPEPSAEPDVSVVSAGWRQQISLAQRWGAAESPQGRRPRTCPPSWSGHVTNRAPDAWPGPAGPS
ncbi:hypothetical protein B8X03_08520 [Micrococcus luteus]|nr:hypothetical protein B8X03_08520 [Micrococcus luteus]